VTTSCLRAAVCLVYSWVALYTWGLPDDVRRRRREELAADVQAQIADAHNHGQHPTLTACSLISRTLRGVPHDLQWRSSITNRRHRWTLPARVMRSIIMAGSFAVGFDLHLLVILSQR
jgi:hypothetical protein